MNRHLMLTQKIVHHTIGIQTTEYKEIIYGFNRNVTGLPSCPSSSTGVNFSVLSFRLNRPGLNK